LGCVENNILVATCKPNNPLRFFASKNGLNSSNILLTFPREVDILYWKKGKNHHPLLPLDGTTIETGVV
jgi:hypothetical protein